ncbi:MAG: adenine-specific methyltransferase EcoRI family protein [Negativicoccus succinicivorans]|uniref:adenine-specific methyltransferase EcoRI family protein n=1 Tax=Negativicoccus succinicivorans TaxID=620903 RepID=UPI00290AF6CD|nr:adenine-specific methyltransferase EcoRI family protein [Negativicoccus succinicivorans]MDU4559181.1 adenine-specific methyltransferase EcoRI family protein [Negativicoccus succinicivorans]MDU4576371.1 adenine-specific methyltransferase EcoRI family protein [Negativicoccus succinicivorans]
MAGNTGLSNAARNKKDEFYTDLTDIEKEMKYHKEHFKGKTVFCNCDDPFESNFFKYFVLNFNQLGLKKLIATCYATSPISNQQLSLFDILGGDEENKNKPYKAVVTKIYDATGDGGVDMLDVAELFKMGENALIELEGDGDFRSEECLELLKEADIVVTNPPFSLYREYIATLIEYEKNFLIIGNVNSMTYKEIFPLIKENKVWMGASIHSGDRKFFVPNDYPLDAAGCGVNEDGRRFIRVKGVRWWTNLDYKQRHEDLILIRKYNPEDYPKYDNYDAIEVSKTKDIPCDYEGIMGVPITFMDKYNPDQFEILGSQRWSKSEELIKAHVSGDRDIAINDKKTLINGTETYDRIFIRNKHPEHREEE